MPFEKTIAVPSLGMDATWWVVLEVRDVRKKEATFPGTKGSLFVQLGGFLSESAYDADSSPLAIETFRIRYGTDIPDPLPNTLTNACVIRSDNPDTAQIEAALLTLPKFTQ